MKISFTTINLSFLCVCSENNELQIPRPLHHSFHSGIAQSHSGRLVGSLKLLSPSKIPFYLLFVLISTSSCSYLSISKVEVNCLSVTNVQNPIWFRRESSLYLRQNIKQVNHGCPDTHEINRVATHLSSSPFQMLLQ